MTVLHDEGMGVIKDWRKALRNPPAYRIANRTLRNQTNFVLWVSITGLTVLVILYVLPTRSNLVVPTYSSIYYNNTYPLTKPIITNGMHTFRIGIITDLDTNSKSENEPYTWFAYYKKGYLSYKPQKNSIVLSWDKMEPVRLTSSYALKDRGMELSELVVFNGKLLSFDDRTGLIFEIQSDKAVPWILLTDGDGQNAKGFKSEWATVKGNVLYVGSMGKEWTTPAGDFENNNPQYVKEVSVKGEVKHIRWVEEYNRIREIIDIEWPGYMIHESGAWSSVHKRWFFLPRRCSKKSYNETLDERRGCSVLITANEEMRDVQIVHLPNSTPTRGFSSFKFVPSSEDSVIIALRTEELNGKTATYITSFTIEGQMILNDTWVSDLKYEGLTNYINTTDHDCVACLCHARTGCYSLQNCANYSINYNYWVMAGAPMLTSNSDIDEASYKACMKDDNCIINTIMGYTDTLGRQDCVCDGRYDCRDMLSLHLYGVNCKPVMKKANEIRYNNCARRRNLPLLDPSVECVDINI